MKYFHLIIFILNFAFSQSWHNHPELRWKTIETDHFLIHFHEETTRSGQEAAAVAEKIYDPITSFYEFEPDSKTHIIIQDVDDISNGAAYYYDNKIIIWALPLDFDLRGSHRWLNNVITHEFTHIIQIGAAMKYPLHFPASFIQLMNYEDEKREDVLYGYPNVIMSYPLPGVSVPPWLAEGSAQFMYPDADFDFWDSHRDMIVRDRVMNDNLLSFDAMNTFGKRGIGNESTYNQGFLFSQWLSENYGMDVLKKITLSLSNPTNYSIDRAMQDATGKRGSELYQEWKDEMFLDYTTKTKDIHRSEKKGEILLSDGTTNIHPVWSPDEEKFAYLSNQKNDYFGQTDLFIYNFSDSSSEKIASGVKTAPTWVNDSTIIYTKRSKPDKRGSKYFDLYRYTFTDEEEQRLTDGSRLISPVYNITENSIAAITSFDGTSNIMISSNIDIMQDTLTFSAVTHLDNGFQLLSLAWSENTLLVDGVYHQGRQIYRVDLENGVLDPTTSGRWENRDQIIISDGLIYTTDNSGINNLVIEKNGIQDYITNVMGGAFMPSVSSDGKILYSLYENGRYNIAILENFQSIENGLVGYEEDYFADYPLSDLILGEHLESYPYQEKMLSMAIMPRVMVDYKTVKLGFYFFSTEVIDRFSIFGGASTNALSDMDIFLLMEYKKFLPTFYTNLFWISRHRNADKNKPFFYPRLNGSDVDNIEIYNDLAFSLFSGDIGTRFALGSHKIKLQYNYSKYRENVKQNVYQYFTYNGIDTTLWQYGEIGFDYFRGHSLSILYDRNKRKRSFAMNMLPGNGWHVNGKLSYEWNHFMDGFAVSEEYSTFGANFVPHNTARITASAERHFTLNKKKKIVASISGIGGAISNPEVDDFFHFFGGGLPGIKGYTFYEESLTGPHYFVGTATIRLPLFLEKNITWAQFNMQNISLGGIFQFGSAIQNSFTEIIEDDHYKLSAGLECRLHGFSFFSYPSAIAYEYHQPLSDLDEKGKHYFTLLFDY
ncbi:hypothetical protein EB821_01240 [Candidatus Marinimicrobia bacterium PRS2]|nr:hypothetical protein EB821_01240 [Candidatus Marinimicrobia bacterium PRS2]